MTNHEVRIREIERGHEISIDRQRFSEVRSLRPLAQVGDGRLADLLESADPSCARQIGRHLWGALELPDPLTEGDRLAIRSDDPHVLALPWPDLDDGAGVLVDRGVQIEVSHLRASSPPHLDARPEVVLAVPEDHEDRELWEDALADTGAKIICSKNVEQLPSDLAGADIAVLVLHECPSPHRLTLEIGELESEALFAQLREYPPRILLFSTSGAPSFRFLERAARISEITPSVLVVPEGPSDSEGPPQPLRAIQLVRSLLVRGHAPFCACLAPELEWEPGLRPRCFGGTRATRSENPPEWLRDDSWRVRLDRRQQAFLAAGVMTAPRRRGGGAAILWHGAMDSGLERFHGRLRWELRERGQQVVVCSPRWPISLEFDREREFAGMYEQVLGAQPQDLEPGGEASLRHLLEQRYPPLPSGAHQVLFIDHQVLPVSFTRDPIAPEVLGEYLGWFRRVMAASLPARLIPILGLALVDPGVPNWGEGLRQTLAQAKPRYRPLHAEVLPQLPDVCDDDVLDFLEEHQLDVPEDKWNGVVEALLRRTQGRYDPTLRELEQLPFTWQTWWSRYQREARR